MLAYSVYFKDVTQLIKVKEMDIQEWETLDYSSQEWR